MNYNPATKPAFVISEWNKCRIECIGASIRTFINGMPGANLVDNMTLKGFIALQVHQINKSEGEGQQIAWRDIRIQTENLKPSPLIRYLS